MPPNYLLIVIEWLEPEKYFLVFGICFWHTDIHIRKRKLRHFIYICSGFADYCRLGVCQTSHCCKLVSPASVCERVFIGRLAFAFPQKSYLNFNVCAIVIMIPADTSRKVAVGPAASTGTHRVWRMYACSAHAASRLHHAHARSTKYKTKLIPISIVPSWLHFREPCILPSCFVVVFFRFDDAAL